MWAGLLAATAAAAAAAAATANINLYTSMHNYTGLSATYSIYSLEIFFERG
jgi:hypothetical protein